MNFSLYDVSVPPLLRTLGQLAVILEKAAADAEARKIDPAVFVGARLAPDMLPLSRQIQIACDGAKGCAARLGGTQVPSFPDTETTLDELLERVKKTRDFIASVDKRAIEGSEGRRIELKFGKRDLSFDAKPYITDFVLPHVYFHVTTAYAILRHNGVPLGKMDYLGEM